MYWTQTGNGDIRGTELIVQYIYSYALKKHVIHLTRTACGNIQYKGRVTGPSISNYE